MKKITASRSIGDGNWYINIRNIKNSKTIGDGGEGYVSKSNAVRAIKKNWGDGYTFEVMKDGPNSITFRMVPRAAADLSKQPVYWDINGNPVGHVSDEQLIAVLRDALAKIGKRSGLPT